MFNLIEVIAVIVIDLLGPIGSIRIFH